MSLPTTASKRPARLVSWTGDDLFFSLLLLIELSLVTFLIWDHRMPRGHDGFQYYSLQYYFLNNAVISGEIPQWMPFMTQGSVSNWNYSVQAGMMQNSLLLMGGIFKGGNFLSIYYFGILFDELVLLLGTWLLAKRYFEFPLSRCFAATTVLGSCIWMDQPWFNFHFYYAIPLILHFFHVFLDTGRWRYCFLGGNLLAIQTLGNMPYYIPVTSLVVSVYFATYLLWSGTKNQNGIPWLTRPLRGFVCMTCIAASFISAYLILKVGTDQIANYNVGRNPDGTVPLVSFLTYANNMNLRIWTEMFLGVSPCIDCTLYLGMFSVPMLIISLVYNLNKHSVAVWASAILLVLLSLGGMVSFLGYACWPMMKYYRHLSLLNPVAKLFLCFAAGFGVESLARNGRRGEKWMFLILSLGLCGLTGWLFIISNDHPATFKLLYSMLWPELLSVKGQYDQLGMSMSLKVSALWSLLSALILVVLALSRKRRSTMLFVILAIQIFDLFGYKYYLTLMKTFHASESQYRVNDFRPLPYAQRRNRDCTDSPRAREFKGDILANEFRTVSWRYGIINWTADSYLFNDEVGNLSRVDHWLFPLDDFMKAYWGQPLRDAKTQPLGLYHLKLDFPTNHVACLKFCGINEDKIQVFSDALRLNSDAQIASEITSPGYRGDKLFLSDPENGRGDKRSIPGAEGAANMRLAAQYDVLRFDANHLVVAVETTGVRGRQPSWLFYSDVWHPFWKATVNGEQKKVYKANLAYKAVQIGPGKNIVHFSFVSKTMTILFWIFGFNCMFWVGLVLWLVLRNSGLFNLFSLLGKSDFLQNQGIPGRET